MLQLSVKLPASRSRCRWRWRRRRLERFRHAFDPAPTGAVEQRRVRVVLSRHARPRASSSRRESCRRLRRARRPRGAPRRRRQRAVLFVFAAIPPVLGMIARALHPDLGDATALPTLFMQQPAVLGRRARPRRDFFRRSQRRRRHAVHAGDLVLAGPLQALHQPRGGRRRGGALRARVAAVAGSVLAVVIAIWVAEDVSTRSVLLHAAGRQSVRPDRRAGCCRAAATATAALCAIGGGVVLATGVQAERRRGLRLRPDRRRCGGSCSPRRPSMMAAAMIPPESRQ